MLAENDTTFELCSICDIVLHAKHNFRQATFASIAPQNRTYSMSASSSGSKDDRHPSYVMLAHPPNAHQASGVPRYSKPSTSATKLQPAAQTSCIL